MSRFRGKQDGPGGRNEHYDIGRRKDVPRRIAIDEVKKGRHKGTHIIKVRGREYLRDNPDGSGSDNINR